MSAELAAIDRSSPRLRTDRSPEPGTRGRLRRFGPVLVLAVVATWFVLVKATSLDLAQEEARIGLAAGEPLGPFGQVFGGWDPSVMPLQYLPAWLLGQFELGRPTAEAVRWPLAIAGVGIGLILARRLAQTLGSTAGVLVGLTWFGSLALMHRAPEANLDLMTGLGVIAALDRILSRGSDWVAGIWASWAFLAGGWPPLVVIGLAIIVVGRNTSLASVTWLAPVGATFVGWSVWAWSVAPVDAWAAALAFPLTQSPAFGLAGWVLFWGLPWTPLVALLAWRSVREGWSEPGRSLVIGWLQVAGACLLAGTLIPGLATASRMPALAGLAVAAASGLAQAWHGRAAIGPRRTLLGLGLGLALLWMALTAYWGVKLALAVSYYRPVALVLMGWGLAAGVVALVACWSRRGRLAILALVLIAVGMKIAHAWVYVPEWNYRVSQGPWGRAIARWVPPRWTIYITHPWRYDLMFATERPVRQLADGRLLEFQPGDTPKFVLLHPEEFEHWPELAPPLRHVRTFQDEFGWERVLARTEGELIPRTEQGWPIEARR